jgi:hypothetical protein
MEKIVSVQVYENVTVSVTINSDGYTFKTPKGFGGRYYASFCNHLADAFAEQYPELEYSLRANLIGVTQLTENKQTL